MRRKKAALSPIRKSRKRSFLLFELLISILLVSLIIVPLVETHISMRRGEAQHLQRMQMEPLAQHALCSIQEKLFEKSYRWEELIQGISDDLSESYEVILGTKKSETYHCHFTLIKRDQTRKPSLNKEALVLSVKLVFSSPGRSEQEFYRTAYLEREI